MTTMTAADSADLLSFLRDAEGRRDEDWRSHLSPRKAAELEFHDVVRDAVVTSRLSTEEYNELHGNKKYYSTAGLSADYVANWIRTQAKGRVFLDYACGNGGFTLMAAEAGAKAAIGLDISAVSVDLARSKAEAAGLKGNSYFIQGDCEATGLPDNSVDVILCSGMLHHLDLSYAFPEIRRILKPGGVCLASEALDYNPAIKLYRKLTPTLRTEWEKEHILSLKDLAFARRFFQVRNVHYWHLCSIFLTPLRRAPFFGAALKAANAIDGVVLRIPPISYLAWQFTFELVKRTEE
jgi:SAM-dependent methyltransferase